MIVALALNYCHRQTFVPVMLTLTPAESGEVVVAAKKVSESPPSPHVVCGVSSSLLHVLCVMVNRVCTACSSRHVQDIVKDARIAFDMDIGDALLPIMITDPSPALRKGHYDFARAEEEEIDVEDAKVYHCTDYAHVYRKITGCPCIKTAKNRDYMKWALECCHRAPTMSVARMVSKIVLADLLKCEERELIAYLTRKGTGFFTPGWFTWNIMSCRFHDEDGVMYLVGE